MILHQKSFIQLSGSTEDNTKQKKSQKGIIIKHKSPQVKQLNNNFKKSIK